MPFILLTRDFTRFLKKFLQSSVYHFFLLGSVLLVSTEKKKQTTTTKTLPGLIPKDFSFFLRKKIHSFKSGIWGKRRSMELTTLLLFLTKFTSQCVFYPLFRFFFHFFYIKCSEFSEWLAWEIRKSMSTPSP